MMRAVAKFAIVVFASLLMSACCSVGAMRCMGSAVQLCGTHRQWETVADCSKISLTDAEFRCVTIAPNKCRCRKAK